MQVTKSITLFLVALSSIPCCIGFASISRTWGRPKHHHHILATATPSVGPPSPSTTGTLHSPFIEKQDPAEQLRIFRLAREVEKKLGDWVTQHPKISSKRVRSLSLTLASGSPFATSDALEATGRVSMWIFAIDDLFDEQKVCIEKLVSDSNIYVDIARGVREINNSDDPMAVALGEIIDRLSEFSLFVALRNQWANALAGTLEAMHKEHEWRTGPQPSYDEYLRNGVFSVGGPPHFVTWTMAIGDLSAVEQFSTILELAETASACIRLANDLQTFEREIEEGNINSLSILQSSTSLGLQRAQAKVKSHIKFLLAECKHIAAHQIRTATGAVEIAFMRLAWFVCDFYDTHDFHHQISSRTFVADDPTQNIQKTLALSSTAYDTAWVASLRSPTDSDAPRYPRALKWIVDHQHQDGSWGGSLRYCHDRIISTLAALRALLRFKSCTHVPSESIGRARDYLWKNAHLLGTEPDGLVGFELLLPTLIHDVGRFISLPTNLNIYDEARREKLRLLPPNQLYSRHCTAMHSIEFLGKECKPQKLAEAQFMNGSIGNSPAATAFLLSQQDNLRAAKYLENYMRGTGDSSVTVLHPCQTFDALWGAYNRLLGGTPAPHVLERNEYSALLTTLQTSGGISIDPSFPVPDADDTAVALILLSECGMTVPWHTLDRFRSRQGHYVAFPRERHSSPSVNIHVLDALRRAPPTLQRTKDIQTVIEYIMKARVNNAYWTDKWHISPYYVTSHIVIILDKMQELVSPDVVSDSLNWIRETQNADGSWGFDPSTPTCEETAYCVLALCSVTNHDVSDKHRIERGMSFLLNRADTQTHPPLWIGKCLYLPINIVRTAIDAALQAARHHLMLHG